MAVTALAEPDLLAYADDLAREIRAGARRDDTEADGWALAELGRLLGRPDLLELTVAASTLTQERTRGRGETTGTPALVTHLAALACAVHRRDVDRTAAPRRRGAGPVADAPRSADPAGATTHLLGLLVGSAPAAAVRTAARRLRDLARHLPAGTVCWPDADGRARTGLAHGTSGVILALAEAAARHPVLESDLVPLIDGGLRWESAWFDPTTDTWTTPATPAENPWAGPVGIALTRLRLLALRDAGLNLTTPRTSLVADAQAALRAGTRAPADPADLADPWDLGDLADRPPARGDRPNLPARSGGLLTLARR